MSGLLLIAAAAVAAVLFALAGRFASVVTTFLVAYLAYVANLGVVTMVLSPFREVTRGGLAVAEAVVLLGAIGFWWLRGRPLPPWRAAASAARSLGRSPVTAFFGVMVLVLLAYELLLALTTPPNNMDSLTYHLTKAAAWAEHGGIYWIPNAPEVEITEYQPLAEQQNLFLFVATGGSGLFALPQYLAELACLLAVFGSSRRLGFELRAAAASALLFAMFSVVGLESMTAQNDLVAASLPAVAACLLLGPGLLEPALGGVAGGLALGVKLTTGLALPVLVWLAWVRGRRVFAAALTAGLIGFAVVGMWGYVFNLVHTGDPLGAGTAGVQDRGSPSYPGSVATAFYLMYGLMDLSVLSNHLIALLAAIGLVAGAGVLGWRLRGGVRRAWMSASGLALPFLAPALVLAGAALIAYVARVWGFPIRGPGGLLGPLDQNLNEVYTRFSNEDYSAFGPIGIVALVAAIVVTVHAYLRRRADARQLVLASALPLFLVLVSLTAVWVPFLIRYFLLPAVLCAPLLACLFRGRATTAAYLAVAAVAMGLTITNDQSKPLSGIWGRPWNWTQFDALADNSDISIGQALVAYDALVPGRACVGAVLGPNEPAFLLYGAALQHRVVYLPLASPVAPALRARLGYVVLSPAASGSLPTTFADAGWKVRPLGSLWVLASRPGAGAGACTAA